MKLRPILVFSTLILTVIVFSYCKKKKTDTETPAEETAFDKPAMLANYSDSVIIPNLVYAKNCIDALASAYDAFSQNKTLQNLQAVRQKYIDGTVSFQHIATFEFGPSESEIIRSNFNTYPTDTARINTNINSGNYNLSTLDNLDAKGFPAIDFLLYGKNRSDNSVLSLFTTAAKATERTMYIKNCLLEMQAKMNTIVNAWKSSYRGTFIASTGSQIGSSLGVLLNQLDFEIDLLKNGKIGIPLGKKSLDIILPEKCEAYYANTISIKLAKECLANIENVYLGRSMNGTNGLGLEDLLVSINATRGSGTLDAAIKNQFAIAKDKLAQLSEPLSAALTNNTAAVNTAYTELVKLLVLLKTDTPSALGIVITYQDGDGD